LYFAILAHPLRFFGELFWVRKLPPTRARSRYRYFIFASASCPSLEARHPKTAFRCYSTTSEKPFTQRIGLPGCPSIRIKPRLHARIVRTRFSHASSRLPAYWSRFPVSRRRFNKKSLSEELVRQNWRAPKGPPRGSCTPLLGKFSDALVRVSESRTKKFLGRR
jgi:hypothetical protein